MKNLFLLFSLLAIIGFSSCNSQTQKQETQNQEVISSALAEINVEGMTCTGCENSINKSVEKLAGIAEVKSSHVDKKTVVKYDESKVTVEEIKEAIAQAGYTIIEPEANE